MLRTYTEVLNIMLAIHAARGVLTSEGWSSDGGALWPCRRDLPNPDDQIFVRPTSFSRPSSLILNLSWTDGGRTELSACSSSALEDSACYLAAKPTSPAYLISLSAANTHASSENYVSALYLSARLTPLLQNARHRLPCCADLSRSRV